MKKMIKITLIVIGAFVSFIPINISANESKKIPNIGKEFYLADFVSPVYEGDDTVTVYNRKDEEMTKKFIVETRDYYNKKDYKKIKEYLLENDFYVTKKANEYNSLIKSTTSGYYSEEFLDYVSMTNGYGWKAVDIMICYKIICRASSDHNYNIVSYDQPSLTKTSGKVGWFIDEISTNVINKGKYININVSFRPCWRGDTSLVGLGVYRGDYKIVHNVNYNPIRGEI